MIPDKIYISLYPNHSLDGFHLDDEWVYEPHKEVDNIEYIRKEALLEWAKKELESAELTNFDEFGSGEVVTWIHIIDKLNSI